MAVRACVEEVESNNSMPDADIVGTVPGRACGIGTIEPAGDFDVWAFEVSVASLVRIETVANWYDGDTIIGLYNVNGQLLASDDDSGADRFSLIDLEVEGIILDPGYYFIVVQDYDADFSSRQPYELEISGVAYAEPEAPPAGDLDCDLSRYDRASVSGHFHFNSNQTDDGYYDFAISNDTEHPLRWSGNTFSVSFEERYSVEHTDWTSETVTTVSVSGTVSPDCRTLLTATFTKERREYEDNVLYSVSTEEVTLVDLPLDQAGVTVPRCNLEGQQIATHVAHIVYQWDCIPSPSDSYHFESFSLHANDGLRFELHQRSL